MEEISRPGSLHTTATRPRTALDVSAIRRDFPIFSSEAAAGRFVFLDSAASSQKPRAVMEAMDSLYEASYANVHRGVYRLAEAATAAYEAAREKTGRFIHAPDPSHEVVFTRNVTEALNLVARSWADYALRPGDVVVLTEMEHHSNLVPWLMLAERRGLNLRYIGIRDDGYLDLDRLEEKLTGAKVLALSLCSNVLGTIPPVRTLVDAAHAVGAVVIADAAQYVPSIPTDLAALGVDFLAFTGHKMLGPTGIGVLWGKAELLDAMPPFLGGGEMIADVRLDGFRPAEPPAKFEAGTPPIAEAIGLAAAIDYLCGLGMDAVREHELSLVAYALERLGSEHAGAVRVFGPNQAEDRGSAISFVVEGVHAHDVAQVLDSEGVCVRAGHHCAKPLMRRLGVPATARASVYVYNDTSDIDALSEALWSVRRVFAID